MKIIDTIALISINETLVFQLLSFLLFAFILHRVMVRPLTRVMEERTFFIERIEDDIDAAEDAFEALEHQIKKEEAEARKEAFKIRDDIEASGQASAGRLLEDAREKIRQMHSKERQAAEKQLAEARRQLGVEAETIAEKMITVLLNPNVGK